MVRQLRARTNRPNYAVLAGLQSADIVDDVAGPSKPHIHESEDEGSEFEIPAEEGGAQDDAEDMIVEPDADDVDDIPDEIDVVAQKRGRSAPTRQATSSLSKTATEARKRTKPRPKVPDTTGSTIPVFGPGNRQTNALPDAEHRHRTTGVYKRGGKIERLVSAPTLFGPEVTTQTNAWGESTVVSGRVNKALGFNIGSGPLWEIIEDRAWYKESRAVNVSTDRALRPRVHEDVQSGQYQLLSVQDSAAYLPTDNQANDDGTLNSAPPVPCSFGPFGKQTRLEIGMFDSLKLSQFFRGSKAHVFNAGAPVWGIDWCPMHPDDRVHHRYRQYLAVAPFPSRNHSPVIGSRIKRPMPACIQIWSLKPSSMPEDEMDVDGAGPSDAPLTKESDAGEMRCEMVLCVEGGPAFDLKWCPLPSGDHVRDSPNVMRQRKLGIIGGTFEDGSLTFYAVPDPETIVRLSDHPAELPVYVRLEAPLLRIELEDTCCWSFDWANSEAVAVGCTNGSIAVYNIASALWGVNPVGDEPLLPTHYISVHQSAIRSLAWVRAPVYSAQGEITSDDPTVIISGGYDGLECITEIRDMCGCVLNRTRDVVTSMCFATYSGSAVTIDNDNMIKAYSVSPSTLGRGHTILEPNGPVWSLAASDYHPQIAIGVSDGSCMTTNMMRSTRRGGSVPFLQHKIYQLDYNRALGEYRMLEQFLPKETNNRPVASRQNKSMPVGTGAWPSEVGIHRVVWNNGNGLARTPLLASATAAGLCRVDWLLGRWARDVVPYDGIQGMRAEMGTTRDDDEDDESE